MKNPVPYVVLANGSCVRMSSLWNSGEWIAMPGSTSCVRVNEIMDQVVFMEDAITEPEELVTLTNAH